MIALCQKTKQNIWVQFGTPPRFQGSMQGDPEQNAGKIRESNPEHLLVFKALRGDDQEQNAGMIHKSNPRHLLVFKAPRGDDPPVQSGTPPCF